MRPLASSRFTWWDSLVSALIVLALLAAIAGLLLAFEWLGARAVEPLLGIVFLLFAFTVQRNSLRAMLTFAAGWLIRG